MTAESKPASESVTLCGAPANWGPCTLIAGHNRGRADVPANHRHDGIANVAELARRFSLWLDGTYPSDLDPETHMRRRVLKVCEESGEVAEAVGAYWQENPRKPAGPIEEVIKELADCAGAALGAIEHLTGHRGESLGIVTERVREVCERVGVPATSAKSAVPDADGPSW